MKENNSSSLKSTRKTKIGRFNLIDFLLIVVILLIIAAMVYVFLPGSVISKLTADKTVKIDYAIEIIGVDEAFIDNIEENDVVLDAISKNQLGTVTAIDYNIQTTELKYNESENIGVLSQVEKKRNVIVFISAEGEYEEGKGYTINGTRIAVGEKINARFPDYVCEAYCISIPRD